jgi:hypothetical protein
MCCSGRKIVFENVRYLGYIKNILSEGILYKKRFRNIAII